MVNKICAFAFEISDADRLSIIITILFGALSILIVLVIEVILPFKRKRKKITFIIRALNSIMDIEYENKMSINKSGKRALSAIQNEISNLNTSENTINYFILFEDSILDKKNYSEIEYHYKLLIDDFQTQHRFSKKIIEKMDKTKEK